jgi:hypothetical protein
VASLSLNIVHADNEKSYAVLYENSLCSRCLEYLSRRVFCFGPEGEHTHTQGKG